MTNFLGTVVVTAYCACFACCNKTDGITASGVKVSQGRTAAANWLPFKTRIRIQGVGVRVVEDRMARRYSKRVDVYFKSHTDAKRFGIRRLQVWRVSQ